MLACSADTGEDISMLVKRPGERKITMEPIRNNVEFYNEQFGKYMKLYSYLRNPFFFHFGFIYIASPGRQS